MPVEVGGSGRGVNALLRELTAADRGRLLDLARVVSLAPGPLGSPDRPIETVLFPLRGLALFGPPMRSGVAPIAGIIATDGVIGSEACLATRAWPYQIEIALPMLALSIDRTVFVRAIESSAALRGVCGRYLARLLTQLVWESACAKVHRAYARLATWLIRLSDATGAATLPLTHETLARIVGVSRQTITKDLARFERDAMVSTLHGRIALRPELLHAYACECLLERIPLERGGTRSRATS